MSGKIHMETAEAAEAAHDVEITTAAHPSSSETHGDDGNSGDGADGASSAVGNGVARANVDEQLAQRVRPGQRRLRRERAGVGAAYQRVRVPPSDPVCKGSGAPPARGSGKTASIQ